MKAKRHRNVLFNARDPIHMCRMRTFDRLLLKEILIGAFCAQLYIQLYVIGHSFQRGFYFHDGESAH
jgi:hypothetical protein